MHIRENSIMIYFYTTYLLKILILIILIFFFFTDKKLFLFCLLFSGSFTWMVLHFIHNGVCKSIMSRRLSRKHNFFVFSAFSQLFFMAVMRFLRYQHRVLFYE